MTGTLWELAMAAVLFVVGHLGLSAAPVRRRLVARLGEWPFRGLYSVVAIALLVWMVVAYGAAPADPLWVPPIAMRHVALTVMAVACVFVVAAYATPNPTMLGRDTATVAAAGPVGIFKVTRHPAMWGAALWGVSHLLANGDGATLILSAAITVLALAGAAHLDARKRAEAGEAWTAYAAGTSFVPLAALIAGRTRVTWAEIGWWRIALGLALYAVLLWAHEPVIGVTAFPLP